MKILILGGLGAGKTTLIVEEITPSLEKCLFFDFCNEYHQWIKNKGRIKTFKKGLIGKELQDQFRDYVKSIEKDVFLIIDNAELIAHQPKLINDTGIHETLSWLIEDMKDRNIVMAFNSILSLEENQVPDFFDKVYMYPTRDNDKTIIRYLANLSPESELIIKKSYKL